MSYSYENLAIDKSKLNYLQKCFYLINLIKMKDTKLWEKYHEEYLHTKPENSWDFYQALLSEYRKLLAPPAPEKKTKKTKLELVKPEKEKKTVKKKAPVKKKASAKKKAPVKKKEPVKKKAPAKKKVAKKATKKK